MNVRGLPFFLFMLVALGGLIGSSKMVKEYRQQLPPELVRREALAVDPGVIKAVSGEFKGLAADYLLIKAAVIDGGEPEKMTDQDWHAIYVLYKQSMALDPWFYSTAYYTQGNLVWREGMAKKAIEILELSGAHRTWDWAPKWFLGFDYANFLNDNAKAAAYLYEAAKIPHAPPVFGILAARLVQNQGRTLTAITMLKAMYDQTDNEEFKEILKMRIEAHTGLYRLEQAISLYQKKYSALPESLDALVTAGILAALPDNPFFEGYIYDPATGKVDYGQQLLQPSRHSGHTN